MSVSSSEACCCSRCRLSDAVAKSLADAVCDVESLDCFYQSHQHTQLILRSHYGSYLSVRPSVCLSVCLSVIKSKTHEKCKNMLV